MAFWNRFKKEYVDVSDDDEYIKELDEEFDLCHTCNNFYEEDKEQCIKCDDKFNNYSNMIEKATVHTVIGVTMVEAGYYPTDDNVNRFYDKYKSMIENGSSLDIALQSAAYCSGLYLTKRKAIKLANRVIDNLVDAECIAHTKDGQLTVLLDEEVIDEVQS